MTPRYVKPGEMLAMASGRLHQDRRGFFWMMGAGPLPNERRDDTIIVHIRGELEHHKDALSCSESYEGILEKFRCAYAGESVDEEGETVTEPPKSIVLVVDSPGGVVSGLNECVAELQRMRAEHPDIAVSAYVNEMATSAAYALACSCDEIVCPPSAIIGSIGVISTMISAAARDKKDGFDVRLITSGERKADGHMHAPISDAAISAETQRVDKLALAFFRLAGKARGLSVNKIRSLQAGIFLGKDAIRVGLADDLQSFDEFLTSASGAPSPSAGPKGKTMTLNAILRKLSTENDPKERKKLTALLASTIESAYKKTEKHVEHTKTEEEDEGEEPEEESEDDEKEAASEKDEKKSAASEEKSAAAASADDEDDEDDEDDGDDAKSAKKALALVQTLTGMRGKKALGALQAIAMTAASAAKDVEILKREGLARDKANLIASAKGKYLTAKEATWLAGQKMSTVKGFVEMRQKSGVIVNVDDTTLVQPKAGKPGTVESLPQFTRDMIDQAVASAPAAQREKVREELNAAHLKAHNAQMTAALNGAAEGRY